jgi:hypothetical protein
VEFAGDVTGFSGRAMGSVGILRLCSGQAKILFGYRIPALIRVHSWLDSWLNSSRVRSSAMTFFPQVRLGGLHPAKREFSTPANQNQTVFSLTIDQ